MLTRCMSVVVFLLCCLERSPLSGFHGVLVFQGFGSVRKTLFHFLMSYGLNIFGPVFLTRFSEYFFGSVFFCPGCPGQVSWQWQCSGSGISQPRRSAGGNSGGDFDAVGETTHLCKLRLNGVKILRPRCTVVVCAVMLTEITLEDWGTAVRLGACKHVLQRRTDCQRGHAATESMARSRRPGDRFIWRQIRGEVPCSR